MPRDTVRIVQDDIETNIDSPFRTVQLERYMHPIYGAGFEVVIEPGQQKEMPTLREDTEFCMVTFDDLGCRITFDGSTPTADFGHYMVTQYVIWSKCTVQHMRFASVSNAKTARVHISQFKADRNKCGWPEHI
jgi:hypothetical protein